MTEYIGSWRVIMKAIVGSTAYGLDHAGSDIDYLSAAIAPTSIFLGLEPPALARLTIRDEQSKPDEQTHELGKFCNLLFKCGPAVVELLWMPEYEVLTDEGRELIAMRQSFLSRDRVREAFLGYAEAQFQKLLRRGDGTFSSDVRNRSLKHARHLYRLTNQGLELYSTGDMTLKVRDREAVFDFAERVIADPVLGMSWMKEMRARYDEVASPLPEQPNHDRIEAWLRRTRVEELLAAMGGQYQ